MALSNSFFCPRGLQNLLFIASWRKASRIPIGNLLWNTMILEML
jgi:hypothetical protein